MGHGKHVTGTSYEITPPPVADYNVTGDGSPSPNCNYFLTGYHNGKPYYRRNDGLWYIYWDTFSSFWYISQALGRTADYCFIGPAVGPTGFYNSRPFYTGSATVSAGPH